MLLILSCVMTAGHGVTNQITASVRVTSERIHNITAPYSGIVQPYEWKKGDAVPENSPLFSMVTTKIYATEDGVIGYIPAKIGDVSSAIIQQYHAIAFIEPDKSLFIQASTQSAYNKDVNKYLHSGETLYARNGDTTIEGVVTLVAGSKYQVEISNDIFVPNDLVTLYRQEDRKDSSRVGKGTVVRYNDVPVLATGRIVKIHVKTGDSVKVGDLLFETIDEMSGIDEMSCEINLPYDGILTSLNILPGSQIYKGQLLCTVLRPEELEFTAEVDEVDLQYVEIGETAKIVLDAYPNKTMEGTVKEIVQLGNVKQNATYFQVIIEAKEKTELMLGMNGTAYFQ